MKTNGCSVTFESCDAAFVKKFGPAAAENMVLDFHAVHPALPFLYDASQLADFLSVSCGALNHLVNHIQDAYHPVMIPKHSGGFRICTFRTQDFWPAKNKSIEISFRTSRSPLSPPHTEREDRLSGMQNRMSVGSICSNWTSPIFLEASPLNRSSAQLSTPAMYRSRSAIFLPHCAAKMMSFHKALQHLLRSPISSCVVLTTRSVSGAANAKSPILATATI